MPEQDQLSLTTLGTKVDELERKLRFVMLQNLFLINTIRESLFDDGSVALPPGSTRHSHGYARLGQIFDELYDEAQK